MSNPQCWCETCGRWVSILTTHIHDCEKPMNPTTGQTIDPAGVDHPLHYNAHKSGIEVIEIIRHLPYDLGAAFKYVVRPLKGEYAKDLRKAIWYLRDHSAKTPQFIYYKDIDLKKVEAYLGLVDEFIANDPDEVVQSILRGILRIARFGSGGHEDIDTLCAAIEAHARVVDLKDGIVAERATKHDAPMKTFRRNHHDSFAVAGIEQGQNDLHGG